MRALPLLPPLLVLLLLATRPQAQGVKLEVTGGTPIKVEKVVTVQVEGTLINSFPFFVSAPSTPNTCYIWTVPPAVYAIPKGNLLEVKSAPKGQLTIDLMMLVTDFETKKVTTTYGQTVVQIGKVEPKPKPKPPDPCPPEPDPEPPTTFEGKLQVAYTAEKSVFRERRTADLATLYRNAAKTADEDGTVKTWGQLFNVMSVAAKKLDVAGKLVGMQTVIQEFLKTQLPSEKAGNVPLDTSARVLARNTFLQVAAALEACK